MEQLELFSQDEDEAWFETMLLLEYQIKKNCSCEQYCQGDDFGDELDNSI